MAKNPAKLHWEIIALFPVAIAIVLLANRLWIHFSWDLTELGPAVFLVFAAWMALIGLRRTSAELRAYQFETMHRCAQCGYDLRASTERCPECGTPIPPVDPARKPEPVHPVVYLLTMTVLALLGAAAIMIHTAAQHSNH